MRQRILRDQIEISAGFIRDNISIESDKTYDADVVYIEPVSPTEIVKFHSSTSEKAFDISL